MEQMEMSQTKNDRQARLTLLDLLVGTAAAAIFSALNNSPGVGNTRFAVELITNIYFITTLLIFASGGTGLFLFARRWWNGWSTDFQPGHWLLCLIGVMYSVIMTSLLFQQVVFGSAIENLRMKWLSMAVFQVLHLWAYLTAGFLLPVRSWWRIALIPQTLIILAMLGLVISLNSGNEQIALFWFERTKPFLLILDIVVLLTLVVWDTWTAGQRRDWIHWWGVTVAVMMSPAVLLLEFSNWMGWFT
ncbi:hypothetical protein [Bremerella alba]|uniref:Uncharacterized protein n=1 Tax=Bremerella alba TaxID=980252 RepID=A0A7V8V9P3_9BACT|nr:hypothetical protein [Bremerella alba]MBA2117466.1 hypothetical protein [Bremerella alba]